MEEVGPRGKIGMMSSGGWTITGKLTKLILTNMTSGSTSYERSYMNLKNKSYIPSLLFGILEQRRHGGDLLEGSDRHFILNDTVSLWDQARQPWSI